MLKRDALSKARNLGFTLTDLLVIVAALAILAGMLLSSFSKARVNSQDLRCLNNGRQLTLALHLYAADHQELFPPNEDNNNQLDGWVAGDMAVPVQATNTVFLTDPRYAKLAQYTGSEYALYRCPADTSVVTMAGENYPRVRSVSMNQAVGTKRDGRSPVDGSWLNEGEYGNNTYKGGPYRTYGRLSDCNNPAPDRLWILTDEASRSLNDAGFAMTLHANPNAWEWIDWPAAYHDRGCGLAFADGHSEVRHWLDPRTAITNLIVTPIKQPNNPDLHWMMERTTAKK